MPTITDKRRTFHELHKSGCFVIPNPWDIGSARYLQHLGFKALATTSAGFAFWQAYPDHGFSRDLALAHLQEVVAATDLPVNADFEGGFAHNPAGVAESVRLAVETGVAGLSIEDMTGDKTKPLYDFEHAVARVRAARQAIDHAGGDTLLVGRTEASSPARPTSTRRSEGSKRMRRPVPIASMRPGSRRAKRSQLSLRRLRRSRSTW
jgi:2-methylisocitrate lyase-like PEP mutase family enzyme